jgi:hypothetical protein
LSGSVEQRNKSMEFVPQSEMSASASGMEPAVESTVDSSNMDAQMDVDVDFDATKNAMDAAASQSATEYAVHSEMGSVVDDDRKSTADSTVTTAAVKSVVAVDNATAGMPPQHELIQVALRTVYNYQYVVSLSTTVSTGRVGVAGGGGECCHGMQELIRQCRTSFPASDPNAEYIFYKCGPNEHFSKEEELSSEEDLQRYAEERSAGLAGNPITIIVDCIKHTELVINVITSNIMESTAGSNARVPCFSIFLAANRVRKIMIDAIIRRFLNLSGVVEIVLFDRRTSVVVGVTDELSSVAVGACFDVQFGLKRFLQVNFAGVEKMVSWSADDNMKGFLSSIQTTFAVPLDVDITGSMVIKDIGTGNKVEIGTATSNYEFESCFSPLGAVRIGLTDRVLVFVVRVADVDHKIRLPDPSYTTVVSLKVSDCWDDKISKIYSSTGLPAANFCSLRRARELSPDTSVESLPLLNRPDDLRMWDTLVLVDDPSAAASHQTPQQFNKEILLGSSPCSKHLVSSDHHGQQNVEMERKMKEPEPLLIAIFHVVFSGHPLSPIDTVGVFMQKEMESLLVPLREQFNLPPKTALRVYLDGAKEYCSIDDIFKAAASSQECSSLPLCSNMIPLSTGQEQPNVSIRTFAKLRVQLRLHGSLLIAVAAVPYTTSIFDSADKIAADSKLTLVNPLESVETTIAKITSGLAAPAGFPVFDNRLFSRDDVIISDAITLRNGDCVVIKCYSMDGADRRDLDAEADYEAAITGNLASASDSSSINSSKPVSPAVSVGDTHTNSGVQPASMYQRVVDILADCSVKLAPSKVIELCRQNSTVEQAVQYFWSNPVLFADDTTDLARPDKSLINNELEPKTTRSTLYIEIESRLKLLGISLTDASIVKLTKVSSTVDGAQDYYFCNSELFEQLDSDVTFSVPPPSPPPRPAPSSASIQTSSKFQQPAISPRSQSAFCVEIEEQFAAMGLILSSESCQKLSLSSSSMEGALNYYWSNPELFETVDENSVVVPGGNIAEDLSDDLEYFSDRWSEADIDDIAVEEPLWSDGGVEIAEFDPIFKDCIICQDSYPVNELFTVECRHSHRFCFDCMFGHIQSALRADTEEPPHIPACPSANVGNSDERCDYLLTEREINQVLDSELLQNPHEMARTQHMKTVLKRLYISKGYRDNNCIRCVGCSGDDENAFWFQIENNQQTVRCPRADCGTEFCSSCHRTPSHYACACDEVMAYSRAWLSWTAKGRDDYINAVSSRNSELQREREAAVSAHSEEVRAAEARFHELTENENYKAQHCKYCPTCRRVVEKVGGTIQSQFRIMRTNFIFIDNHSWMAVI